MTSAAFEEIQMDEDDVKPTNDTLENNSNLNESMVSNDADDEDDEKPPVSSSSLMQPIDDDSNNQLPLVFVRESLTLCDLHRRVAQDAQLCARFAEIRCSDANCEAIAFVARADDNQAALLGSSQRKLPLIRCRYGALDLEHGCPVQLLLHKRAEHERKCAFRPVIGDDDDDDDDNDNDGDNGGDVRSTTSDEFVVLKRSSGGTRLFPEPEPDTDNADDDKDVWTRLNETDAKIGFSRKSRELGERAGESLVRARDVLAEVTAPVFQQINEVTAPVFDKIGKATAPMRTKISNSAAPLVENAAAMAGRVSDKFVNDVVPAIANGVETIRQEITKPQVELTPEQSELAASTAKPSVAAEEPEEETIQLVIDPELERQNSNEVDEKHDAEKQLSASASVVEDRN
jgi:hypothetical protein